MDPAVIKSVSGTEPGTLFLGWKGLFWDEVFLTLGLLYLYTRESACAFFLRPRRAVRAGAVCSARGAAGGFVPVRGQATVPAAHRLQARDGDTYGILKLGAVH